MNRPRICAVMVNSDLAAARRVAADIDLFEVRLDLIGDSWPEVARQLNQPWIATNRIVSQGGRWPGSEAERIDRLLEASHLGADIVDIELETKNLKEAVSLIKKKTKCLLSYHELNGTPPLDELKDIVRRQQAAGADICKVVTTARRFDDNLTVLQLITEFPQASLVALAMGPLGLVSRVLCPLVGGYFTYASIEPGKESAPGQITVADLIKIYQMLIR